MERLSFNVDGLLQALRLRLQYLTVAWLIGKELECCGIVLLKILILSSVWNIFLKNRAKQKTNTRDKFYTIS